MSSSACSASPQDNRAKAIRFTTLIAIRDALGCQPADLFSVQPQR
jgi:putative transcriptional regulator